MAADSPDAQLPPDPTFPPSAYARTALLMRGGVVGFFILTSLGLVINLIESPTETVDTLLASGPAAEYGTVVVYFGQLFGFRADPLILLGIFVLVAVTIGRVLLATVDFYRGREWALAGISAAVVAMLLLALFVIAPVVH